MNDIGGWIERDEAGDIALEMLEESPVIESKRDLLNIQNEYKIVTQRRSVTADILISMRLTFAAHTLKTIIEIDREKAAGAPVLAGTRFKISRVLAELADGMTVSKMAREFRLDKNQIVEFLRAISILFDRPFSR